MCSANSVTRIRCKMILIIIYTFLSSVFAIPTNLLCCPPGLGEFEYIGMHNANCWDEKSNKTHPLQLSCNDKSYFSVHRDEEMITTITETGQVFLSGTELKPGEVCFTNLTTPDENIKLTIFCAAELDERGLGFCMLINTIFLLLTCVVYAALPEIRDLQGKSIVNFCGSMGIGLGILAGSKFFDFPDTIPCIILGFSVYFFLIAAFFWSNAIAVQMLLSLREPVVTSYSWKEFSWYALYAWGCPTVLTLGMAIINFHPGDHKKPGIGLKTCWFYNYRQQWYYMFSVMTILIVVNICIFVYMTIHFRRLPFFSSHVKALRYKFIMILRMFTIMVVSWIFEMISSIAEHSVMWFIIDLFNTIQGPLTFLLLVAFRKQVLKALLKRGYLFCIAGPVEKYLANKEDEEEVNQHIIDVTMNDRKEENDDEAKDGNDVGYYSVVF